MKMETRVSIANLKHNKNRNLLIGIAICLTTLLLFLIPGATNAMVKLEFAAINEIYPTWHTVLRNVEPKIAEQATIREDVEKVGLRCDVGEIPSDKAKIGMTALDQTCAELNKIELSEGSLPQKATDIVVSHGILEALGMKGKIGDTIKIPYQVLRQDGLDYQEEGTFTICGMLKDTKEQKEKQIYGAYVSQAFAKQVFSEEELRYYAYIHLQTNTMDTFDSVEKHIEKLTADFGLKEEDHGDNMEYVGANYVDPSMIPIVGMIMLVIIFAGIITIYSIYYVSMPQRIQDYGRLRAIGATKKQVRSIVLREGMLTACIAIPIGLLIGTPFITGAVHILIDAAGNVNAREAEIIDQILREGSVNLHPLWLYALSIGVSFFTVWLSLRKPMKTAAKITPIEAMRFQNEESKEKKRNGYDSLNLFRVTKINLMRNKKRTLITVLSMGMTGILFLVVATILSCADPREITNAAVKSHYQIQIESESGNKEHPELEWGTIQQNNPLNEEMKQKVERLPGVVRTEYTQRLQFFCKELSEGNQEASMEALPDSYMEELKKSIVEGTFDEKGWKNGTKILASDHLLHWEKDLKVGDVYHFQIETGNETIEKEVEVMGIVDLPPSFLESGSWIVSAEAMHEMSKYNANDEMFIYAEKEYDEKLEKELQEIIGEDHRLSIETWQEEYEMWVSVMGFMRLACYGFLGILGVICIMNLINTVVNSIHLRMKEIGMMQAIGLSEKQLMTMLQLEGLFYTAGALLLSICVGSIAGYGAFLWAKADGMFNIQYYHYPTAAALLMSGLVIGVQLLLVFLIGKSLRKQSMIDRIRFSE